MSVTTTENPVTTTLERTLQDYEIRVTGADELPPPAPAPAPAAWVPHRDHDTPDDVENPPDWPSDERRGVPRFRPINRALDREQRPWGSSPPETVFVAMMFTGVYLEATASWLWRQTGGRFNSTYFRYKIGGEV
ncbi:hypothetical protein F4778DRAFT_46702 [Xylariomycetidae sp. FL2044]|nr:hypothetical protein F4778DRAFT_693629 [Xylariomycetidae sp. FL2044]KAH9904809.1 hypothetical protein F4778DRAFT_46702 [Xylariomycetidae sp. FL2044]